MVFPRAYLQNIAKNPLKFEHIYVESIVFFVNGEPTPKQPFQRNVTENIYPDALLGLYGAKDKLLEDTSIGIIRVMYKKG